MPIDLADDERRLDGKFFHEIEAQNLRALHVLRVRHACDAHVGVRHLSEILLAHLRLVNRHGDSDLIDVRRHFRKVDRQNLVVSLALAREVVARMMHRAVRAVEIAVEDEVLVLSHLAVRAQEERRGIEVEVRAAVVLVDVPAEADERHRHALVEAHALSLGKIHRHVIFLPFSRSPESTSQSPTDSSSE